eukprot:6185210-Pleurochrysis_carterae.AAC.3
MKFGEMLLVMLLTVLGMRTIGYLFYPDGNNGARCHNHAIINKCALQHSHAKNRSDAHGFRSP